MLAARVVTYIRSYLNELTSNPQTGRRADEGFRELVIPFGRAGFVALYDYNEARSLVHVASIRHQREAGYR
jgi:plasmid stabilization system protein ParE